jgi:hypothetical protein
MHECFQTLIPLCTAIVENVENGFLSPLAIFLKPLTVPPIGRKYWTQSSDNTVQDEI